MCTKVAIEVVLAEVRKSSCPITMETAIYIIVSHLNITEEEARKQIAEVIAEQPASV